MATLSSASTNAQVWAAYDDNASFEEDASLSKAQAFVTACMLLLRRRPTQMTVDGNSAAFDARIVQEELNRARKYVNARRSAGSVRFLDFGEVRT